eukprot:CAMPEP_0171367308 /NCGR_PEP_ID=MMETSP0879-20121228/6011_1 /TAXON_ID=67004 /ORGANISM="Thalassiosira weissflogii, Strain CCMP1336" /LENGTH=509 /DNA_ID=CAMNT_0011875337 /DNA_START=124 /DNA_END=1650 /DNA_ORIENTATION=-
MFHVNNHILMLIIFIFVLVVFHVEAKQLLSQSQHHQQQQQQQQQQQPQQQQQQRKQQLLQEKPCTTNNDCPDSTPCAHSQASPWSDLACCSNNATSPTSIDVVDSSNPTVNVCRIPVGSLKIECFDVCTNRATGAECMAKDAICASGVCGMDDTCEEDKLGDELVCLRDDQCKSGICALSEALEGGVDSVCCANGSYVFDSQFGRVCSGRSAGAACGGNNDVCATGVCGSDELCKDDVPGKCSGVPAGCGDVYETMFGVDFNGTCDSDDFGWNTRECEHRRGCQCNNGVDEGGLNIRSCSGTPVACEEHLDAYSCNTQGGCKWEKYYPGICIDSACGPLHRPALCSRFHSSNFELRDSCETNLDKKCGPSCTGGTDSCVCKTADYDCSLEFKNGLTQNVCEGITICDRVGGQCGTATSRNECLALRKDGFGCDWMVLWDDWEENSGNDSGNDMELNEDKDISSIEESSPADGPSVPGGNPASPPAPSYSHGARHIHLHRVSYFFLLLVW